MATKQRRVAFNRLAIADRDAMAAVVRDLSKAAGGIRKLAGLGGMNPGQLSRLARGQAHELEPESFRMLYQVCALVAVKLARKDQLEAAELRARVMDWKRRLDAAVLRPDPPRVISLEQAVEKPGPLLLAFLERVIRDQTAPIPDAWPRNQWVRVPERATAVLNYPHGMLTMPNKDGEHYALLWDPRQK